MNAVKWNQVQTVLKQLMDADEPTRATHLGRLRDEDPDIFREVSSLLAADADNYSILDGYAVDAVDLDDLLSLDGSRIGPYRVIRKIGSGGMGNVYLAEREEGGFEQQVALKLIRHGMDSARILRRFESERQIHARLQHPGIARLFDGGITTDGRPWFAMEYVEGEPVGHFCNKYRLSVDDRLKLFIRIAGAVQYAHNNLIVHRDLKPDNILVSGSGKNPEVKLLDFGIARMLGEDDSPAVVTRDGARPMTPAYASPEQLKNAQITTSSDVYSLGVVLYELLAGRRPFEQGNRSMAELEQEICNTEPPRPGTVAEVIPPRKNAVQEDENNETEAAGMSFKKVHTSGADLSLETVRLRKRLQGDLDVICLKALNRDPASRYQTVEQFSADIERHLSGRPVLARPESGWYKTRKFIQRHKPTVFVAILLLLSLIGGVIAFAWQYNIAASERDRARLEAETSHQVAGFLQGLFASVDPSISRGDTLTARQLLDRGSSTIRAELAGQPDVQARMLDVLGKVYLSLWMFDEALSVFQQALEIRINNPHTEPDALAASYLNLGNTLNQKGNYASSDSLLSLAAEIRAEEFGNRHPAYAEVHESLGSLRYNQGLYPVADDHYRQAISIYEQNTGPDIETRLMSLYHDLGWLYHVTGDGEMAETYVRQALDRRRELYGSAHPEISVSINALAQILVGRARYDEARELHLENIEIKKLLYGDDSPITAIAYSNYSAFLKYRERYSEAEDWQQRAHSILTAKLGNEHPHIAMSLNNLANLKHDQMELDSAEYYHRLSLGLSRKIFGNDHNKVADSFNNLATLRLDQGDYAEAESLFREALRIDRLSFNETHPYVAMDYQSIGISLMEQGNYHDALDYLLRSIEINTGTLGESHPNTVIAKGEYGYWLLKTGDYPEAERVLKDVLDRHIADQPEGSWRTAEMRSTLGECLLLQGKTDEAGPHLIEGYEVLNRVRKGDLRFTDRAKKRLISYYEAIGDEMNAKKLRDE
jgi:eukaryotic-like serine/threonine-protein kinase